MRDPGRRIAFGSRRLGTADERERNRRHDERERVDEDREWRAGDLDEGPRESWPADLSDRRARRKLAVALDDAIDADERWHVGGGRRAEERREAGLDEGDRVQLLDPERADRIGDRDPDKKRRADDVGPHEDGTAA